MATKPKKTIVHVNQHVIRSNQKTGEQKPVLTVKRGKQNRYAHQVELTGPCRVVYADGVCTKPLSCGARVWIETDYEVKLFVEPQEDK
jgi:hypothetical protein